MIVRKMAPGPGGVKERRAPRRSGPPALLLAQAPVQGSPGGPFRGPLGGPRAPAGIPEGPQGSPQKPRAPSSLPSPLPFPSLLFPFPPPVPGVPQDWVGERGTGLPLGGACLLSKSVTMQRRSIPVMKHRNVLQV